MENVFIPMSDGQCLAARIWLPEDAETRPVPAIMEYIPYRKRDITRLRDAINHPYLAGHGYACVRVDLRGSGDSQGVLRDQYLDQEQDDGVEAIQWIARQPWCDGQVGMFGISWGGFNALQIAARRPPALKAILAVCATDDLYADNMHYMGGCLLADNLSEATTMFAFNSSPPDPEIVGAQWRELWLQRLRESGHWLDIWLRQQRRGEFWKRASVCENYGAIRCPVFAVSGWADGYTNAVFRLLAHLEVPRKGLVGPWGHKYPHLGLPGPAIGFLQETVRWFDHWLKDRDTGIMDEPLLRVWMQDSVAPTTSYQERPGRWVTERAWPSPDIVPRTYRLERDRLIAPEGTRHERAGEVLPIRSPLTTGLFAGKWCSYAAAPDLPDDQRQEDGGALVFDSDILEAPLEILGAPEIELEVRADRPVAMIAARLSDVLEDGSATRVTFGLLNLCHRESSESPRVIELGRWYRVRVALNHVAQSFPAGHRIRIALSTSYWPLAWPPPEPVKLELDVDNCRLHLPVRPPQPADGDLRPFGAPEGAPEIDTSRVAQGQHNWFVVKNLAENASELQVINDDGRWRIEEIDTEIEAATYEWYRCRAADFDSVEGETRTVRGFQRRDWAVRTVTRTVLNSDRTHFYLRAELDAYEGRRRIFSMNWDRRIRRDCL
ncbi:MAG: CocE/NonD family hydrolase [Candidatus Competibacterales bacterium]|nr:CocE/NonD family hydrolase [Candidatus Competibacterales bacterium]